MTLTTQYAIDIWRLQRNGQAPPPAPGTHEAKLLSAWWTARKEARKALATTEGAPEDAPKDVPGNAHENTPGNAPRGRRAAAAPRLLRRRAGRA